MPEPQDPNIGRQIDEYSIVSLLGKGGMGSVYRAYDEKLKRTVALKLLAPGLVQDADAVRRFAREARILAEIKHPNIAHIFRIGKTENDHPFYTMEYVEGKTLQEVMFEKGRLPVLRGMRLLIETAKGLQAASSAGIIHRDIKPANIMLLGEERIKILDFGIARSFADDSYHTATGMLMGTPRYMSPEQGRGVKVDHRTDIYSLGATFYHLFAGVPPFDADNPINLIQKHMNEPLKDIKQFNPNLPDPLCRALYGMLEKRPSDRISDYNQIIIPLENLCGRKDGILTYIPKREEESEEVPVEVKRKIPLWVIPAGVVVVIVILVLVFGVSNKKTVGVPAAPGSYLGNVTTGLKMIKDVRDSEKKDGERDK
ncbi:TPA: hypothetical protein DDW35_03450 [Candidatus Sumerlaeota bacterium]|jgi:eukaryotic-like serine/threonine-protein kinase|nr:hypothetical protein [Candidatus Sumerlaeota bacterium]